MHRPLATAPRGGRTLAAISLPEKVSAFQIRGRAQGEDVIIGISGIETFPDDVTNLDFIPGGKVVVP